MTTEAPLGSRLDQLVEAGYVIIPDVLSTATLTAVRKQLAPYLRGEFPGRNDFEGFRSERVYALLDKAPAIAELVVNEATLPLIDAVMQPNYLLSACLAIQLHPGETAQTWHFDDAFVNLPRPRVHHSVSTIWAIDDFTTENGATEVLPGTHRWGDEEAVVGDRDDAIVAEMSAGSVLVFLGTTMHRGGANRSDRDRLAITPQYCAPWARPQETFTLAVRPEMVRRYPPRVRELLGYSIHPPFMGHVDGRHPAKTLDTDAHDRTDRRGRPTAGIPGATPVPGADVAAPAVLRETRGMDADATPDLVITNGTVVDGTGGPRAVADVAVFGERILAVGPRADVARLGTPARTIDATGLLVTPGWVDIHTHFDGQATWDPDLAPSSTNGVTSIVMGNCGVGFAPARPDRHDWLISLLEGVEDIPGTALAEGMTWGWESFEDYLDVLESRRWSVDVGTQVPHAALRTYVMGDRGADHLSQPTTGEIAAMNDLTRRAVEAGALGFTTSRTWAHRTASGESIGTLIADADEVLGVAAALRSAGTGVVQLISDAYQSDDDELVARELALLERLALEVERPMSFTVQQNDDTPDRFRELLAAIERWNELGADVKAQVASRPIGVLVGLAASANPLLRCASYRALRHLPHAERVEALRDRARRASIIAEHEAATPRGFPALIHRGFDRMYPLTDPVDYEPTPDDSIAGLAERAGVRPVELLYDTLLEDDGGRLLYIPLMNYARGDLDDLREMITSPHAMFGLSDAGAHCNAISDGTFPTTAIAHWTRDRSRGDRIPLEHVVHQQTQRTAEHVGWTDRGVLAPGRLADINVIDHERLTLHPPELVRDLPAAGTRLLQRADGYVATIKRGVLIAENGTLTGARPGRLQRGPCVPR